MKIDFIKSLFTRFNENFDRIIGGGVIRKAVYLGDIIYCFIMHGSSLRDYFDYEFYKKRNYEKKQFVTWRRAQNYFKVLQNNTYVHKLNDKAEIYKNFSKYLGRKWIYIKNCSFEQFEIFCRKHRILIVKPHCSSLGRGVKKVIVNHQTNLREWYLDLIEEDVVLEEYLVQHCEMSAFHPESVNTVRVTSVLTDDGVKIMNAAFRMGNKGSVVDNHGAGGIAAAIDINSGTVMTTGVDKYQNRYIKHPITGKMIVGFQIPFWDEVIKLVMEVL
ncbi:MAG: sugar-transfer associated ATP-grasp domain-containing protein [Dethiobacteria bacterium]